MPDTPTPDALLEALAEARRGLVRLELAPGDRFLLLRLLDVQAATGAPCRASVAELAADCSLIAKSASRALTRLEAQGWIVAERRSRLDVDRSVALGRLGECGLRVLRILGAMPPHGGEQLEVAPARGQATPPHGGNSSDLPPARGESERGSPPHGGHLELADDQRVDLVALDPPPNPPHRNDLREDEDQPLERPAGVAGAPVAVTGWTSARARVRQLVGHAWLVRRGLHPVADDTNERRVASWLWTTAGEDPGALEAVAQAVVERWVADPYIERVRWPWRHLQSQLATLYEQARGELEASKRGEAPAARLEAELERAEQALIDAMSCGSSYEAEQAIRERIDGLRAQLRRRAH